MNKPELRQRQNEEILMTLDQVSQTLEVMSNVVNRLKLQVCAQLDSCSAQRVLDFGNDGNPLIH